jgi:hypothetical protein
MSRSIIAILCVVAALGGCSSRDVIELKVENQPALALTDDYNVSLLRFTFRQPHAWEINDDDWKAWVEQWQVDFREELRTECFKSLHFPEPHQTPAGATVTCAIYEMDRGGSGNAGTSGFVRAHVVVKDGDGKIIYDARLEGAGSTAGFESTITRGRLKYAILDLARQVADVLENG